jgi:quinol monooxygenase YgiN
MIVIAGSVAVHPERRDEAVRAALEMARQTRQELGCITYCFSSDLGDPNRFLIFEEWSSADALAAHFESEHMKRFRAELPALLAGAPQIKRYVVESVQGL